MAMESNAHHLITTMLAGHYTVGAVRISVLILECPGGDMATGLASGISLKAPKPVQTATVKRRSGMITT